LDPLSERYSRQVRFAPIGPEGQERLRTSSAVLVGCGALGASIADALVRGGLGRLRIVDRDFVDASNLQRQTLFDEEDAREGLPKAEAARRRLVRVNSQVEVEARVEDLHPGNVGALLDGFDLLLDGTDNFATRYLLNDVSVSRRIPWVYGAAVGSYGLSMPVLPGVTACLRCVFPDPPDAGTSPTCDTAGVIAPVVGVVSSLEVAFALKILAGRMRPEDAMLHHADVWEGEFRSVRVDRREDCPACGQSRFDFLHGKEGVPAETLCGRDAVQIRPARGVRLDLARLEERLRGAAEILARNPYVLHFRAEGREAAVFLDGRTLVRGTQDAALARAFYRRFVGE
jgi:adenylyltransferase/sulfurtransferase